jgi:hypothetical protein
MPALSKSKLIAWRQCPKRLWLEIHQPSLAVIAPETEARFQAGNEVGAIAQRLYDPEGRGVAFDIHAIGVGGALKQTPSAMARRVPVFEAAFTAGGGLALGDVLLPTGSGRADTWRMIEVKSATSVKDYHRDDAAIQAHIARSAGVTLDAIAVARIDNGWTYPGGGDYQGLLVEEDLTDEAFARGGEVSGWIKQAAAVAAREQAPEIAVGDQCHAPFDCPFFGHCSAGQTSAEFPVDWLPQLRSKDVLAHIARNGVTDMRDVPDTLLNERQLRVKTATLSGTPFFDAAGAARDLAAHQLPAAFLDFEAAQFAVPRWAGTRPYQQIPFQFSAHRMDAKGKVTHQAFLDLSGDDPSVAFVAALSRACGASGPVFVYNASFESARLKELAERLPRFGHALSSLQARIVDLLPITRRHYYHPSQKGSWSIKAVLPAIVPDLGVEAGYDALDGVKDGMGAVGAYFEAIDPATTDVRRDDIRRQLLAYCRLDTLALVKVWERLTGRS